jgi:hypothetical protein
MSCLDNTSVGNGHMTSSSAHTDALFYFLYSIILLLVLNTVLVCVLLWDVMCHMLQLLYK